MLFDGPIQLLSNSTKMVKPGIKHHIRMLPPKLLLFLPKHPPKRPDSPITHTSISLPDEILLYILSYLTQDSTDEAGRTFAHLAPRYVDESFRGPQNPRRPANSSALFQIALVCRSWYTRVIWLLYQHPILITFDQIRLFRGTVEHYAHLAQLVRTISIVDTGQAPSSSHADIIRLPRHQPTTPDCLQSHLSRIFHYCTSLSTACIALRVPSTHLLGLEWANCPRITYHLRSLKICGNALLPNFRQLSLPNLEDLSIEFVSRNFLVTPHVKFPRLPKVSTLRLSRIRSWAIFCQLLASTTSLPSLRSLELLENTYHISSSSSCVLPPTLRLESFCALGSAELLLFGRSWHKSKALGKVRHLGFGVSTGLYDILAEWMFPPFLESLTIVVKADLPHDTLLVPHPEPLQHTYWCLERNFMTAPVATLKSVLIYALTHSGCDIFSHHRIEPFVEDIRALCRDFEIQCLFEQSGM